MRKPLKRYNNQVYFPDWYSESLDTFLKNLNRDSPFLFSPHAVSKLLYFSRTRRYADVNIDHNLTKSINLLKKSGNKVFEFYSKDQEISKACFRFPIPDSKFDIIVVVSSESIIVTIYFASKDDNHSTLNTNLYEKE